MAVVFPRPPPTCNNLTTAQRAQLLKSTAKLGQVLGSTPHVLDEANSVARSYVASRGNNGSNESLTSYASSSTPRSSLDSTRSSRPSPSSHSSEKVWRIRFPIKRPPMLRIGKTTRALETIPGSPAYDSGNFADRQSVQTYDDSPPSTPSFNITSDAAMRRQKMRRLAKKFGEGVPLHLVFPPTTESDDEEVLVDSPVSDVSSHSSVTSSSGESERDLLWEKHTARRSKFVEPPKVAATVANRRYIVHYKDTSGAHGQEGGLKCTTIPEERDD
ncbi:hypothetical protein BDY19DRAFT_997531 [Irpex rosettiformis]|uniref:Uncharacterized protein n=1 Tax=Irpex rosettiformis TaxID=378272 RepID=A0ACB8TRJ1_9APHY|nr:hypothetical protein BDY19DRAFT_997531 [Irpex rosettiformis]